MATLPPPPINDKPGSFTWLEWYRQLRNYVSTSGSVPWYIINFAGSNITDIALRDHNNMQSLQGGSAGQMYHLSQSDHANLTGNNPVFDTITANDTVVMSGTISEGIKLEPAAPTFGWHDMLGPIEVKGVGPTDPTWEVFQGNISCYRFDVNDVVWISYHLLHDYVPGSDIYLHTHWAHNSATVTTGSVTFDFEVTYAKGHNQAAFSAPKTVSVTQTASTTQYQHMIAETAISIAGGDATRLDSNLFEPDGLILVRVKLAANTMDGGAKPFVFLADAHYQSTGVPTKNKAPNFYV